MSWKKCLSYHFIIGTDWQIMGANKDSAKLYCNRTEFVRFKDVDFCQEVSATRQGQITIYGELKKNTWRGQKI